MAESDFAVLTSSLSPASVARGVTAGVTKPNGGGSFVYGFNSLEIVDGASALACSLTNFYPTSSGGSVRAAMMRAAGGGNEGFAPFIFMCLQGPAVSNSGYLLGLGDDDPYHIVLRKGSIASGLPDLVPDPDGTNHVLMRSTETYEIDTWLHLRLDVIVQGSGDVLLQCYQNDLDTNPVTSPVWTLIPGMEGPLYPGITGFVDDALGINTGSVPYTSGRGGFAFRVEDATRRSYFDAFEMARQI